eukprot:jgi/Astpho2/9645/Aster-03913
MHPVQPVRLRASKASKAAWGALGNKVAPRAVPRERAMPDHLQAPTQLDLFGLRAKAAAQAMLAHHPRSSEQDPIMVWAIEHADAIYRAAEAQASPRTMEAVLADLQSQPEPVLAQQQPPRVVSH